MPVLEKPGWERFRTEKSLERATSEKTGANSLGKRQWTSKVEPMRGAFFWLSAFFVVYCARPEDWVPGLKFVPLAKISGIFALAGLLMGGARTRQGLRKLPREAYYLIAMIALLFLAAALSPVWKGGATVKTLEFAKVLIAWVLTYVVVISFERVRRILFIQAGSVAVIAVVSIVKGRGHPRLDGVLGGIYSNPNDLAFAIVLALPFCAAFLLSTKKIQVKLAWLIAMLVMCLALFMTASRGGFITLVIAGMVGLWHFGVKGRRPQLIAATILVGTVVGLATGGRLKDRFMAISGRDLSDTTDQSAYGSYEQRRYLIAKSLEGIEHYPLGIGLGNFPNYSGKWRDVHVAYLQIMVEGGILCGILYVMFFWRGFLNLRQLKKLGMPDKELELFAGALHSSLVGFLVGALFSPEAYQFFPYFAVAYSSVLLAIARNRQGEMPPEETKRFGSGRRAKNGDLAWLR